MTIKGKVADVNDSTALELVTVAVGSEAGMNTEADGLFSLEVNAAPTINVLFRYGGRDSIVIVTTEPGKSEYVLDVRLGQKSSFTMDVVTFTESRHAKNLANLTGSMDVVNQKKVDLQATSDIKDALVQNSGVDIIDGQPDRKSVV